MNAENKILPHIGSSMTTKSYIVVQNEVKFKTALQPTTQQHKQQQQHIIYSSLITTNDMI